MLNDWLFSCTDYRDVIKKKIQLEGQARGYRSLLAKAAGCQPAYLSQAIAEQVELTPEHAAGLCEFWAFTELESDYFLTLLHLGRSGQQNLTDLLKKKLDQLREEFDKQKTTNLKVEMRSYKREKALFYYLDWLPSAVHLLLTVPQYKTSSAIAKRLGVEEFLVIKALHVLEELGIAEAHGETWSFMTKGIHAADETLYAPHHHRNWRDKAFESYRYGRTKANLHYTSVYSLDPKSFQKIREQIVKAVNESKTLAIASPEETIACLNVDWFEI